MSTFFKLLAPAIVIGTVIGLLLWERYPERERAEDIAHREALAFCRSVGHVDYEWRPCGRWQSCFYCVDVLGKLTPFKAPLCAKPPGDQRYHVDAFLGQCDKEGQ